MRTPPSALLVALALPLAAARAQAQVVCNGGELATIAPYASDELGAPGGTVFFDLHVAQPGGVTLAQLETNVAEVAGAPFTLKVYTCSVSYLGLELTPAAWTLIATGAGVSAGVDQPSLVDFPDVVLPAGSQGVALVLDGASHAYTAGATINQFYFDGVLFMALGASTGGEFSGALDPSVVWNGKLEYDCAPSSPQTYCTAGLTTNNCSPSISASAQPSASLATPCTIRVDFVEPQKQGLIFYGVDNSGFSPTPWSQTSSSFLCVKSPKQRMGVQNSGGGVSACDGTLEVDWNAYQASHLSALGQPFSSGSKVYVQGWFRDPPAPKSTNLSDALEMTLAP